MNPTNAGQGPQDGRLSEALQSVRTHLADQQGTASTTPVSPTQETAETVASASQPADASPPAVAAAPSQTDLASLQSTLATLSDDRLLMVLVQLPAYQLARALECLLKPVGDASRVPQVSPASEAESVSGTDPADNRRADRARIFRAGKIIYNNKMSVSDCHIRDLSDSGCRVVVESLAGIPDQFTLHILTGNSRHECEVAWRRSNMMGLRFIA